MIALMTITAGSHIILDCLPNDIRKNTRRIAKTATLDGGSVIVDSGCSDSDRSMTFEAYQVPKTTRDSLWDLFQDQSMIHLSCPEGIFSGYLETVTIENATVDLTLSVFAKLT